MASFNSSRAHVYEREERRQHYRSHLLGLNTYERHKRFMKDYAQFYGGGKDEECVKPPIKTDRQTLRETYRFIRSEEDDAEGSWEQRLAKRYYDKLFREYCVADMSRYRDNKIGLRWRGQQEVVSGKGQFVCGNRKCSERQGLRSYEVNFSYKEAGEKKQALVKLRVCVSCAYKLNYRKERERKKRRRTRKAKKTERSKDAERSREVASANSGEDTEGSSSDVDERNSHPPAPPKSATGVEKKPGADFDEYFSGMFL